MSTSGTITRRTLISGVNNPAYQVSKNVWNESLVITSAAADGSVLVRDSAQADGWGFQTKHYFDVRDYEAVGDGIADDTGPIQACIDAASHTASVGYEGLTFVRSSTVLFPVPAEFYRVSGEITIANRSVVLQGVGHEGSQIRMVAAGARFNVTVPQVVFRNLFIYGDGANGSPVASNGIVLAGDFVEECVLDNTTVYNFTDACVDATSAHIMRLVNNTRLSVAPVLLRLTNTAAVSIQAANFFQLEGSTAAIEVHGPCPSIVFQGGWAEGFKDFLLVKDTNGIVITSLFATGVRFSSIREDNRLVRVQAVASGLGCLASVAVRDSTLNLLAPSTLVGADYAVEVDCSEGNANHSLDLKLDNVIFVNPPEVAIVLSDTANVRTIFTDITGCPESKYLSGLGVRLGISGGGLYTYGADMWLPGGKLRWPATPNPTAEANTLDDYARGEDTPVFTATGGATGVTYQGRFAKYVKDGRRVTVAFSVLVDQPGTLTGNAMITFPAMPVSHSVGEIAVCTILYKSLATNWVNVIGVMNHGTNNLHLRGCPAPTAFPYTAAGNDTPLVDADIGVGSWFRGTVTYYVDED